MWVPIIVIAWSLGGTPVWVNFPMVNFPFSTEHICNTYVQKIRTEAQRNPAYIAGYSACVEIPTGESL